MTVFQELLILFGAPILVVVAVFAVIYLRHPRPQSRYRPDQPYDFKPVWFVAREGAVSANGRTETVAEIESGSGGAEERGDENFVSGPKGGAHGQW
ncbi:aa3-type cytochrome oxidase subunit CtaJ [Glycomyces xiaoerkulensis]|uniref:aa3-type cytochrome oxidase subunit CtaJ n=1 Tax=Glycomyces xiaoerkulensis TaxID=2038139 RepID=UPI000C26054C|nr:hypothetical protein [Glycomyces xiaoerkulensis]